MKLIYSICAGYASRFIRIFLCLPSGVKIQLKSVRIYTKPQASDLGRLFPLYAGLLVVLCGFILFNLSVDPRACFLHYILHNKSI